MKNFKVWLFGFLMVSLLVSPLRIISLAASNSSSVSVSGWDGKVQGFKSWIVPDTPNGLVSHQSWFSIGSSPNGNIYITGSDHKTNSALFKLNIKDDLLSYIGDAMTASKASNNWLADETAEKFHNRPQYYKGKIYVATTDYSSSDSGYINKRGFHWYASKVKKDDFTDLSASHNTGIGGENASLMVTVLDEKNGLIYGHDSPKGRLFVYNIETGITTNLGTPSFVPDGFYTPGRYMWVDNNGRVYFSISNFNYVMYYDPATGFGEKKDWTIGTAYFPSKIFRTGTMSWDHQRVYASDYEGHVSLFNKKDNSLKYIGMPTGDTSHYTGGKAFRIRAFNITADEQKIYFVNDNAEMLSFWEWDITTNTTTRLCYLSDLENYIGSNVYYNHGGNDTWDNNGCMYFCSFGNEYENTTDLVLSRIDPVKLKVSLGFLPSLVKVSATLKNSNTLTLERTGNTANCQTVVLKVQQANNSDAPSTILKYTIPAGHSSLNINIPKLLSGIDKSNKKYTITVVSSGNDYKAGSSKTITTSFIQSIKSLRFPCLSEFQLPLNN